MRPWWWLALALTACTPAPPPGVGIVGDSLLDPFPTVLQMRGGHVDIQGLPQAEGGTPVPVDRVAWRTGFSPVQVSVVHLAGVVPGALPSWRSPTPGEGGVRLVDLDTGTFLPVVAELDANATDPTTAALLIRPLQAIPAGHTAAVVVTTEAATRPARFDALIGKHPPEDLADVADHFRGLVDTLVGLGISEDQIAIAWDYPVGDGTAPLASALDQLPVSDTWSIDTVRNEDDGDRVAPHTWRAASGTVEVPWFLGDDEWLALNADGTVSSQGKQRVLLYVHIPESVKDAPAGTVPVVVFGHGLLQRPEFYLDNDQDAEGVLAMLDRAGAIAVATKWLGLSADERVDALTVASDFGKLPIVTDRLVQGVAQTRALVDLAKHGGLLDDPVFEGATGQPLPDPDHVLYYGISLGGIEGATLVGTGAEVDAAVLHAGGGAWSTMLERSADWHLFDLAMHTSMPDASDRQLLYATSQLFWDAVDPADWIDGIASGPPVLWQECYGDDQVPNLTTEIIGRSVGVTLLDPAIRVPYGLSEANSPIPAPARAMAQFDPEVGEPPDANEPAPVTNAHTIPRVWPGAWEQTAHFLTSRGEVVHYCGADPCSASNPGTAR